MPRTPTRRQLLAAATITAVGGVAMWSTRRRWIPAPSTAPPAPVADLRVALVGVGGRGGANLAAFAGLARVVALCDVDAGTLAAMAAAHPPARTFADYRRLMDDAGAFDAVVVSTPDHMHAHVAMAAIRLGKHVYVEKPLAHDLFETRALTDAARAAGVTTQLGIQGHAADNTRQAVEWIRAGAVGQVRHIHVWTDRPTWPQGQPPPQRSADPPTTLNWDLWLGCAPARPFHVTPDTDGRPLSIYHPFRWRGWWPFGTGALGDMGCHLLDAPFWACDLGAPASIQAEQSGNSDESAPKWSVVRYAFAANANRGPIALTWYDGGKTPPRPTTMTADIPWPANGVRFDGDAGQMLLPYRGQPRPLGNATFTPPAPTLPRLPGGANAHHADFVSACVARRPASANFDYAGPLTELALLGNLAIRAGKRIDWDAIKLRANDDADLDRFIRRDYRARWPL